MRVIWLLAVIVTSSTSVNAVEKHWFAHEAKWIAIGTFHKSSEFPWFNGWHVTGTITIEEVLWGVNLPQKISATLSCDCPWWSLRQCWPPPTSRYPEPFLKQGVWFLEAIDNQSRSVTLSCRDIGWRPLSSRGEWQDYIRKYKR